MSRYVLIVFRENGYNYDRCSGGREDHTEALLERFCTKVREEIVSHLTYSLERGGLHETASEYQPRQHFLFVNGCPYEPDQVEDWWSYDDEDQQEAYKEGKAIFEEAQLQVVGRIEAAKIEAQRKAEEAAERAKKLLRDQEVNRLARLTKERDELAARLGVTT